MARAHDALAALDNSADVTVTDAEGTIVYVNDRFCKLSRYSRDEILGQNHRLLNSGYHPKAFFKDLWDTVLAGKVWQGDICNRAKDGSTFWVTTTITPMLDAAGAPRRFVVIRHDITKLKEVEQALRESEDNQRLAVEIGDIGMWFHDMPSDRLTWSPITRRQFGFGPLEEVTFPRFVAAIHPGDRERVLAEIASGIKARRPWTIEYRFTRRDGSARWLAVTGKGFYDGKGRCVRTVGVTRDITEKITVQEELAQAEVRFRHLQKMEGIGRLAGGIAHDFNNILTTIGGYCDFLLASLPGGDARREDAAEIQKAVRHATELTRRLLAFGRRQNLSVQTLDLNELASGFARMFRRLMPENITLRFKAARGPCLVAADPDQVEQVLMNLCLNARDAMPQGGLLTIETATAFLGAEYTRTHPEIEAGRHAVISVKDTGGGIDAGVKSRLFEPFVTTKEQGKGTGLGLATVYGIVRQSRGSIDVKSSRATGTEFNVYLPQATAASPESRRNAAESPRAAERPGEAASILLVEDDEAVRRLTCRVLRENGYAVEEACAGGKALDLFKRREGRFDLLLADIVMPGMGGDQLANRLSALKPGLKVILMSGYADQALLDRVRDQSHPFLQKPVSVQELLEKVRAVLGG